MFIKLAFNDKTVHKNWSFSRGRDIGTRTDVFQLGLRATRHPPLAGAEAPERTRVRVLGLLQPEELVILHSDPPQALSELYRGKTEAQRPLVLFILQTRITIQLCTG